MRSSWILAQAVVLLFLASRSVRPQEPPLRERKDEVAIGTTLIHQVVQGVSLTLPAASFISVVEEGTAADLRIRTVVDLSDLQGRIGPIVDSIELPRNTCSHLGLDNLVVAIFSKRLDVGGDAARLTLVGRAELWLCEESKCSRIEMVEETILGRKIMIQRFIVYDCRANERLVEQSFTVVLPFLLLPDGNEVLAVRMDTPEIDLGDGLGALTQHVAGLLKVDLGSELKRRLEQELGTDTFRLSLPPELSLFHPVLRAASFVESRGALAASLEASIRLDSHSIDNWIVIGGL